MVLIDRDWKELSIGCHIHIVDFDQNLNSGVKFWILDAAVDFQAADHFLDLFLAWSIWKKSSNQADYMPNR